jgi:ATP-dependent RNA helicase RhlE
MRVDQGDDNAVCPQRQCARHGVIKDFCVTELNFADLGLSKQLLRALADAGYDSPTPIQARAIPLLLEGADLLGIAQTGTGKTAAFTLPLLDNLAEDGHRPAPRGARALILAPTRELVLQISDSIKTYGRHLRMRQAVVMGGVGQRPQVDALRRGVDILIATPGRLLDLIQQGHADLSECDYLILDEADRMLDMGFINDVRKILSRLPDDRQSLLFSATMSREIRKLSEDILYQPEQVEVAAKTVAVDRIDQRVHHLDKPAKNTRLIELLATPEFKRTIVFTRTKHGADKLVRLLAKSSIDADALHGNKSQNARQRALDAFKRGKTQVLVATDIAARGIDVDDISHVVNFELPNEPESYVHRIGRTARAGAEGVAISFCDATERAQLRAIERLIKRDIPVEGAGPSGPDLSPVKAKRGGSGRPGRGAGKPRRFRRSDRRAA